MCFPHPFRGEIFVAPGFNPGLQKRRICKPGSVFPIRERQPFVWPQNVSFEALSSLPDRERSGTTPTPVRGNSACLALHRIGFTCRLLSQARWALTPPFHYSPLNKKERSSLCGTFRTLAGPFVKRYPVLRCPDFPLQASSQRLPDPPIVLKIIYALLCCRFFLL